MSRIIIELEKEDLQQIIADYYGVEAKQVIIESYMTTKGYGMAEHEEPDTRCRVQKNSRYIPNQNK